MVSERTQQLRTALALVIGAFLFSGFLVEAAHQRLSAKPRPQSTALVPASHDVAVIVLDREAA